MAISDRAVAGRSSAGTLGKQAEDRDARRHRRIAEFQASVRPRISQLTLLDPALEDLADSFPGLLFALVSDYGSDDARQRAIELTRVGASLRDIADVLGLPPWMRRLPAGAFSELFPAFPADSDFALRIGSFMPADRRRAGGWLLGVGDAFLSGGRDFALWTARAWPMVLAASPPNRAGLVAAWAWFSRNPHTYGHALLRKPFDPKASVGVATEAYSGWLKRVALVEWLGSGEMEPWIADAKVGPYEFRMLRRVEDFIVVAAELDNCLEQFAARLANGVSTVAKIMRAGRTVACIEVGLHDTDMTMPAIVQLRGHRNKRVPADLWRKAYDWLSREPIEPFTADRLTPPAACRMAARQELWGAYLDALAGHGDPAGAVAAQRLRRQLLPRLRTPTSTRRTTMLREIQATELPAERQTSMLQRVREHLTSLAGYPNQDNELTRWDVVERLEAVLQGRRP